MEPAVRPRPLGFIMPLNSLHPRSDPEESQSVFFLLPLPSSIPSLFPHKNILNHESCCGVQLRDLLWLLLASSRFTLLFTDCGKHCMYSSSRLWHALDTSKVGPFVSELYVSSLHFWSGIKQRSFRNPKIQAAKGHGCWQLLLCAILGQCCSHPLGRSE